jgi:tellurite resistance protein
VPTLAIFSAPPAVAGNALFAISRADGRDAVDIFQLAIFGTFLFLLAFQLFLVPMYVRTPFTLGFWALTFTAAASARYGVQLAYAAGVPGAPIVAWILTLLATGLIAVIAVASVRVVIMGRRAESRTSARSRGEGSQDHAHAV